MPVLETKRLSDDVAIFDLDNCLRAGAEAHRQYVSQRPFPHIVLENFVDADLLKALLTEWPSAGERVAYGRSQERHKYEWQPVHITSPKLRSFLAELNSEPMLRFIEKLTGIGKLISDPLYTGGGLHETRTGGHLSVHADFNIHSALNLRRRVNLLIYLNEDWSPSWKGDLELWSRDMKKRCVSVAPELGTAVIFNTDLDSFHGVPDALNCPKDRSRRSIAMYYYTAPETGFSDLPVRTTTFKRRPGSVDKIDWRVGARHLMQDLLPPAFYRALKRRS